MATFQRAEMVNEEITEEVTADVIIVGAGVSGTSALLSVLEQHSSGSTGTESLRVVVIDRSEDMYAGLPYGSRSGSASLTVTSLDEFLPDGMRSEFISWLDAHRDRILAADDSLGISRHWVDEHADEIRRGQWESLFVPRRLFGFFLRALVEERLAETPSATVLPLNGRAASLQRADSAGGPVDLLVATTSGTTLVHGRCVVLAVGSPPTRLLAHDPAETGSGRFLDDTHVHGMDHLLQEARAAVRGLPEGASRDILVVGANADALELLHATVRADLERTWDRHVTILSTHGIPDAWTVHPDRRSEYRSHVVAHYAEHTDDADLTASGMYDAVVRDVDEALRNGFCEQDTVDELRELCAQLLERMPLTELKRYVDVYGTMVNRFNRPTGGDYQRTASALLQSARIHGARGHFEHAENGPGGWRVRISNDRGVSTLDRAFGVIINCAGFENVADTHDPFLRSLQDEAGLLASSSRTGFLVDEHFQAAPGVFVAGPLLAGNLNSSMRVWHLESCRRILAMADRIGSEIATLLRATTLESV